MGSLTLRLSSLKFCLLLSARKNELHFPVVGVDAEAINVRCPTGHR
jgi:hypothetical protein